MKRPGPIARRSYLRRYSRLSSRRRSGERRGKYSGKVRLYGDKLEALCWQVFRRAGGNCELKWQGCQGWVSWRKGQMHHVRHRSLGGSDELGNLAWSCPRCHRKEHNQ